MKKFYFLVAGWFVAIVCVIAGSYLYSHYQAGEYDDRAIPYLQKVVPIISQWDPATTRELMAAETLDKIPEEKFNKIIEIFSKMGALRSMESPDFKKVLSEEETNAGTKALVAYELEARYQNGDALLSVNLLEQGGTIEVYSFNLSSQTLAE